MLHRPYLKNFLHKSNLYMDISAVPLALNSADILNALGPFRAQEAPSEQDLYEIISENKRVLMLSKINNSYLAELYSQATFSTITQRQVEGCNRCLSKIYAQAKVLRDEYAEDFQRAEATKRIQQIIAHEFPKGFEPVTFLQNASDENFNQDEFFNAIQNQQHSLRIADFRLPLNLEADTTSDATLALQQKLLAALKESLNYDGFINAIKDDLLPELNHLLPEEFKLQFTEAHYNEYKQTRNLGFIRKQIARLHTDFETLEKALSQHKKSLTVLTAPSFGSFLEQGYNATAQEAANKTLPELEQLNTNIASSLDYLTSYQRHLKDLNNGLSDLEGRHSATANAAKIHALQAAIKAKMTQVEGVLQQYSQLKEKISTTIHQCNAVTEGREQTYLYKLGANNTANFTISYRDSIDDEEEEVEDAELGVGTREAIQPLRQPTNFVALKRHDQERGEERDQELLSTEVTVTINPTGNPYGYKEGPHQTTLRVSRQNERQSKIDIDNFPKAADARGLTSLITIYQYIASLKSNEVEAIPLFGKNPEEVRYLYNACAYIANNDPNVQINLKGVTINCPNFPEAYRKTSTFGRSNAFHREGFTNNPLVKEFMQSAKSVSAAKNVNSSTIKEQLAALKALSTHTTKAAAAVEGHDIDSLSFKKGG